MGEGKCRAPLIRGPDQAGTRVCSAPLTRWRARDTKLTAHPPPIHVQRLPGDEGGIVAGQERHRADQVLRHLDPLDRLGLGDAANSSSIDLKAGRGARASVPGERVRPGAMALTVMPSAARSVASARVKPTTPPLLAT